MRITTAGKPARSTAVRVLHVVGGMDCGGIETWLMHVLRTVDRKELAMDFFVHTREPRFYDAEILERGARLLRTDGHRSPVRYARDLARALATGGPYDVVHSHCAHFSGYVLALARRHGVSKRIAHSHNDWRRAERHAGFARRAYLRVMERQIARHCTHGLAASAEAAESLFGAGWRGDRRFEILHCGLDFSPYAGRAARRAVRREFGLDPDELVLGNVGSLTRQKNHDFMLELMAELDARNSRGRLVLIGDGPRRAELEARVRVMGLEERVIFAGLRDDVPRLLRAFDAFVFPSLFEGLGLALVEAQAAGLPCLVSSAVPAEATVVPALVERLDLEAGAARWADALDRIVRRARPAQKEALRAVRDSVFDIARTTERLERLYRK